MTEAPSEATEAPVEEETQAPFVAAEGSPFQVRKSPPGIVHVQVLGCQLTTVSETLSLKETRDV